MTELLRCAAPLQYRSVFSPVLNCQGEGQKHPTGEGNGGGVGRKHGSRKENMKIVHK